jgi:hypothetical protein
MRARALWNAERTHTTSATQRSALSAAPSFVHKRARSGRESKARSMSKSVVVKE